MKSFTVADLDLLAQGQPVDCDLFRAIFADAEAVGELARLLQARDLLDPPGPGPMRAATVVSMDVSWDELAAYGEHRPLSPERHAAVEHFLGAHFPEALRDPAAHDTVECRGDEDTEFPLPPGAKSWLPSCRPPEKGAEQA